MALDITYGPFEQAVQSLEDQGLDLSGVDLQKTYDEEHDLATLAVLILLATLALRTVKAARALEALGVPGGGLGVPGVPGGGPGGAGQSVDYKSLVSNAVDKYGTAAMPTAVDTNSRVSYSTGRAERMYADPAVRYFIYRTRRDYRVRPEHRLLEGIVLPKNHVFWQTHTPPLAYNCRCKLLGTDDEGLRQAGLVVTTVLPKDDDEDVGAEPSFVAGGKSAALDPKAALSNLLAEKLAELAMA